MHLTARANGDELVIEADWPIELAGNGSDRNAGTRSTQPPEVDHRAHRREAVLRTWFDAYITRRVAAERRDAQRFLNGDDSDGEVVDRERSPVAENSRERHHSRYGPGHLPGQHLGPAPRSHGGLPSNPAMPTMSGPLTSVPAQAPCLSRAASAAETAAGLLGVRSEMPSHSMTPYTPMVGPFTPDEEPMDSMEIPMFDHHHECPSEPPQIGTMTGVGMHAGSVRGSGSMQFIPATPGSLQNNRQAALMRQAPPGTTCDAEAGAYRGDRRAKRAVSAYLNAQAPSSSSPLIAAPGDTLRSSKRKK